MHIYIAKMKKEVAPIVWEVQSRSPPSEIVAVETHKAKAEINDILPKLWRLFSCYPKI